jgi:hypothetical protein
MRAYTLTFALALKRDLEISTALAVCSVLASTARRAGVGGGSGSLIRAC